LDCPRIQAGNGLSMHPSDIIPSDLGTIKAHNYDELGLGLQFVDDAINASYANTTPFHFYSHSLHPTTAR